MSAYQKAVTYRESIIESIGALEQKRGQFKKEIEELAKETTTPEALLKGTGAEFQRLKEAQQEYSILNERLKSIEEQGGVNGLLRVDPFMKDLSNAVFEENKQQLEQLTTEKEKLLHQLSEVFEMIAKLEKDVSAHNSEVERLENEINSFKPFMSVKDLPLKVPYRYKNARFKSQYQAFFNDFQHVRDSFKRQKLGGAVNE